MAKRKTLDDLLNQVGVLENRELTRFARAAGIDPKTLLRVRRGQTRPTAGTTMLLVLALGALGVCESTVRRALA